MSNLIPEGDPARARYDALCAALGGEPPLVYHQHVLVRLSAWWADEDVDAVVQMIRHASRVASQRQSAVIADIAASAAEAIERRTYREPDVLSVGIPVPLARRVLAIVNGGTF
jgi:hypothetical protein